MSDEIVLTTANKSSKVAGPSVTRITFDFSKTSLIAKYDTPTEVITQPENETNIQLFKNEGSYDERIEKARQYVTNLHLNVHELENNCLSSTKIKCIQSIPNDSVPMKFMLEGDITAYLIVLKPNPFFIIDYSPDITIVDKVKNKREKLKQAYELISKLKLTSKDLNKGSPKFEALVKIPSDILPLKFNLTDGNQAVLIRQNPIRVWHECRPQVDDLKVYIKKQEEVKPEDFLSSNVVFNMPATQPNLIGRSKLIKLVDSNTPTNIIKTDDKFNKANSFVNKDIPPSTSATLGMIKPSQHIQDDRQDSLCLNNQLDLTITSAEKSNVCVTISEHAPCVPEKTEMDYRSSKEVDEERSPYKEQSSQIHKRNKKCAIYNSADKLNYDLERFQVLVAVDIGVSNDAGDIVDSEDAAIVLQNSEYKEKEHLPVRRSSRLNNKSRTRKPKYDCYHYY